MASDKNTSQFLIRAFRLGMDRILLTAAQALAFLRTNSASTRIHVRELLDTTSDQVREKAENTKKAVKLRMAVLEIEHHLNRLYPQIGKITCDLAQNGTKLPLQDEALKSRIEVAEEYRERLKELKAEQESHQRRNQKEA
ncbi:MAG: hypothetical protein O7C61_11235 [SAR324 cluster bacterium]|nr:hypothetical protein [SAR324 cluster bacterium]